MVSLGILDTQLATPTTLIENPVLISLRRLVAAAKPYADTPEHWRSLPEDIRYPGALGRIHGYVLDPASQDVFFVGTASRAHEARLDLDLFTVLANTVWSKGLTPAVSLDPTPDPKLPDSRNSSGPQRARIINLPQDALVARILLDADYEMKKINFGLIEIGDKGFLRQIDVLKASKEKPPKQMKNRFWFYPIPLNPNSVRVSSSGRVALYDAGVQVLTERLSVVTGVGEGEVDPHALDAAIAFSREFPRLETSPAVQPAGVFSVLHGITDIVTVYKLLRDSKINYSVVGELARLPYRHLSGPEAAPTSYPGLWVPFRTASGANITLSGGVQLLIRRSRHSTDPFEDDIAPRLERAAASFHGNGFVERAALTFRLTRQVGGSPAAELAIGTGLRLLALGAFVLASNNFAEATRADPFNVDAWAYLALAEAQSGNYASAQSALDHAEALAANDIFVRAIAARIAILANPKLSLNTIDPLVRRAVSDDYVDVAYKDTYHWVLFNQKAGDDIELAVKWWPANAQAYIARGQYRSIRGETDAALRDYERAISLGNASLDPEVAKAFVARAELFQRNSEYAREAQDYTQAIRLDPNNAKFYFSRAFAYGMAKKPDDAIADYGEAIRLDPNFAQAFKQRAELFEKKARNLHLAELPAQMEPPDPEIRRAIDRYYDLTIQDYSKLILLLEATNGSDLFLAFYSRGSVYENSDCNQAIADYTEAIWLNPDWDLPFTTRARCYLKNQDFGRAVADATQAIRLEPEDASLYEHRARVWRQKGELDRSIADYDEALRLQPTWYEFHRNRAEVWEEKGDFERALADYNEIIRLKPNSYYGYTLRAGYWKRRGDYERAIADYGEALRRNPESRTGYLFRARADAYDKNGAHDRAMDDYRDAARSLAELGREKFYKADFREATFSFFGANAAFADARTMLWLNLARRHRGRSGTAELKADAAALKEKGWPYPVIDFYLGRGSADQVLSAAGSPEQHCEALFYVGARHALDGDTAAGKAEFQSVIDACPKASDPYQGAAAELPWLKQ